MTVRPKTCTFATFSTHVQGITLPLPANIPCAIDKFKVAPTGVSRAAHLLASEELPKDFSWKHVDGQSLVSKNLNQHLPQVGPLDLDVARRINERCFEVNLANVLT